MSEDFRLYLDERFNNMKDILLRIEAHAARTNGRVTGHDQAIEDIWEQISLLKQAEATREITCPMKPRLKKLEDLLLEYTFFHKHPATGIALIAAVVASVILGALETIRYLI